MLKYPLFLFCTVSFLHLFGVHFDVKEAVNQLMLRMKSFTQRKRSQTAREYIDLLEGKDKRNYIQKNKDDALTALERSGRKGEFRKTLLLSKILSVSAFAICVLLGNILLAPVLATGLYFIPLWATKFYVYRYDKYVREELETALSLITTSYMRHNDLLKAVEENINHINNPVGAAFRQFLRGLHFVNANIEYEVELLSQKIDNKIFRKWCDTIILCQEDHTLKATLQSIVSKFSDVKAQQAENETNMMLPIREVSFMAIVVTLPIPILYLINLDWFESLVYTFPGQLIMALAATWVFISINKAIMLCAPIEYDV